MWIAWFLKVWFCGRSEIEFNSVWTAGFEVCKWTVQVLGGRCESGEKFEVRAMPTESDGQLVRGQWPVGVQVELAAGRGPASWRRRARADRSWASCARRRAARGLTGGLDGGRGGGGGSTDPSVYLHKQMKRCLV